MKPRETKEVEVKYKKTRHARMYSAQSEVVFYKRENEQEVPEVKFELEVKKNKCVIL